MKTHFAPAERLDSQEIQKDIERIEKNSIINALLNFSSGVLAVVNEQRQILALNTTFLNYLGVCDPGEVLGLRPGEAIECVHAHDEEGGCGTSEFCSSCGAAIAMVVSLRKNESTERKCTVTVGKDGAKRDMLFKVRSLPIAVDDKKYLMLFLADITSEQQAAVLEKVFFHDINNIVFSILGSSELLCKDPKYNNEIMREIYTSSLRLAKEIAIQMAIFQEGVHRYRPVYHEVSVGEILAELKNLFIRHAVSKKKKLILPELKNDIFITTDQSLVIRILVNMIKNAFEATKEWGQVKLSVQRVSQSISFSVWNEEAIPENIQKRIFQRNFSTKEEPGRGLGTYSMKYFGEQVLGGCVTFTSNHAEGTCFRLTLNLN